MIGVLLGAYVSVSLVGAATLSQAHLSATETLEEFEGVCERLQDTNFYFGDAIVGELQQQLADPDVDRLRQARLRGQLGWELSRLGRLEESVGQLEMGLERVGNPSTPAELELYQKISLALAAAHLQWAEDQNCLDNHNADSCILPFRAGAIHLSRLHSRVAGDVLLRHLEVLPEDLHARWLLNLARMASGDYPEGVPEPWRLPALALADNSGFPRWKNIAIELGIVHPDLSGGAAMDDFDGDQLLDLVTSTSDPCGRMWAFRNNGRGGFEDVTEAWGLNGQLGGLNIEQADFDNDGDVDILVLRGAWLGNDGRIRNSLLLNDLPGPTGRFIDVTAAAGVAYPAFPTQTAAWADFDLDGDLDLYVGNESTASSTDPLQFMSLGGTKFRSQLFRNNGDGTFGNVARALGVENERFTKGVAWGDYDNDGDPDLYLSNFGANRLYRNDKGRVFVDVAAELGVEAPSGLSFATWFFDFDNDGDLDLFVADYGTPRQGVSASYFRNAAPSGNPIVYRNEGSRFVDVSHRLGLDRPLLPMGANFGDLDNDGWLDFYLGTGVPELDALMPNVMYRNRAGLAFEDVTFSGGFGHLQKGHGIAFGDLDNDGDEDLLAQMGGAFPSDSFSNALFENPGNDHAWVTLRLEGRKANRSAIGARIRLDLETESGRRSVYRVVGTGGSFGGSSLQQEIGLGWARAIVNVWIDWPGSIQQQELGPIAVNRVYRVIEGEPTEVLELPKLELPGDSAVHVHTSGADRR